MNTEMHEAINRRALFADETADYRSPEEPDTGDRVIFRFRTKKGNAEKVLYKDKECETAVEMKLETSDEQFDFYVYEQIAGQKAVSYYFEIINPTDHCYYGRTGAKETEQETEAFRLTPGFHTPEWAKGAVMYQIFVDRFCSGDAENDVLTNEYVYLGQPVTAVGNWEEFPAQLDVGRFYGGDLQGVWNKLDYLQYLGVEVIYFNPLFVSPSNHKYDTQDYDHIDPHFAKIVKDEGTLVSCAENGNETATRYLARSADPENLEASDRFFAEFMKEVHKRGMRVIIDGVFNHCGSFNKWLDRELIYKRQGSYEPGAYVSKDSPYHKFFRFSGKRWPNNKSYENWWGNDTLPKLNYEDSPELVAYIMNVARKWVSEPYKVDGWRLDVAADLGHSTEFNHKFWQEFRRNVKEANPDAVILAEHYGDASSWLAGDQWDTVMNYDAFMEPVTWFLTGMEKHSDEFREDMLGNVKAFWDSMNYNMCRMQTPSLMTAMNQLSNHDHSRFLTRTNHKTGRTAVEGPEKAGEGVDLAVLREAVMVQMTWPGAPTLYYGDEAGVCGWTDPDNRRTFPWGHENTELIEYHRYMIGLHKKIPALRRGSLKQLLEESQLLAYGRMLGESKCVIVINNSQEEKTAELPVWELGITDEEVIQRLMLTKQEDYNVGQCSYHARDGVLKLELPAACGILLGVNAENACFLDCDMLR